jgi:LacI family transcriptional regulator
MRFTVVGILSNDVLQHLSALLKLGLRPEGGSQIDLRVQIVRYQAAALLHRLISGKRPPRRPVLISPQRIINRLSTDVFANDDEVTQALRFIREHFAASIHVRDILSVVNVSRRLLEQRFRRSVGRTPAAEIRRVRLSCATEYLVNTNWKISQVAAASGFAHVEGMNRVFRRELRLTPNQFRSQARNQGNGND